MRIIFALLVAWLTVSVDPAFAQHNSYHYTLNGRTIATNPQMMSGPYGCRSDLMNIRTQQMVCPGDEVATPDSIWRYHIAQFCGRTQPNYQGYDPQQVSCIGGFVAVGHDCARLPHTCQYFRITEPHGFQESWTVPVDRIHELGTELRIARSRDDGLYGLFARCHARQFAQYPSRGSC